MDENESPSIDDTMRETLAAMESSEGDAPSEAPAETAAPEAPSITDQGASSQAAAAPAPETPAAAWANMPKSWRKEMGEYWGKQDPRVQQYIHEREEQALRGIGQYKSVADQWNNTLKPFEGYIKQYNLNPHEVVTNLAAAHAILRFGSPEQKAQVAALLDRDYGLRQYYQQEGQVQAPPMERELQPLRAQLAAIQAKEQQRELASATSEVERFLNDPANEFAVEAAPRMIELIDSGRATNMREAYDIATRTDPVLFEKIIEKRLAAAARPTVKPPVNVRPTASAKAPTASARGSIEDTMRATLSQITSR